MGTLGAMGTQQEPSGAPQARRLSTTRWRDPRLAIGVVLVAGSVVLGSQVLASADDTTALWSVREDVPAGAPVPAEVVEVDDVRLADGQDASLYLSADQPLPSALVAAHDLAAGELLGRSDVRPHGVRASTELPVAVQDGHRPADLAVGDRVDVWVAPAQAAVPGTQARQVLVGAQVVGVDTPGAGIGGGSGSVVLLGLEPDDADSLPATLTAITTGTVVLVRVDG
jgi:hypothetical protein